MPSRKGAHELPLRIAVRHPLPGVALALQSGRDDRVMPTSETDTMVTFDFVVRVDLPADDGPPRFHGPFTQGPPHGRFVYIGVGQRAGQPESCWDRRAKVPIGGITAEQVADVLAHGGRLAVAFEGRGRDGGPTCASVKLEEGDWTVEQDEQGEAS